MSHSAWRLPRNAVRILALALLLALGTLALFAPAIGPQADPPLLLGFDLRTRDASGVLYREIGTITSTPVPEPASALVFGAALCLGGLAHRFGRGRDLPAP